MASQNPTEATNSYVTDMLSLERHIEAALESQLKSLDTYPKITSELRGISATIKSHIQTLETIADQTGGEQVAGTIKKVGATLAGLAAGVIDLVRNESMPKDLRDNYTACSLATIGYVMLYTTAASLGDRKVADVAQRHLSDYAEIVMTLHNITPAAVIEFLQGEGLPAKEEVLAEIGQTLQNTWRQAAPEVPPVTEGTTRNA